MKENKRALRLLFKEMPDVMILTVVNEVLGALLPYAGIYVSARILNELSSLRRITVLRSWVLLLLLLILAGGFLKAAFLRFKNIGESKQIVLMNKLLSEKVLSMDYCDVDDTATFDKLYTVQQGDQWTGWGIRKTYEGFSKTVCATVTVIGALGMALPLFFLPVGENAGRLQILNHPLFPVLFLLLIFALAYGGAVLGNREGKIWTEYEEDHRFGNRMFGFFGIEIYNRERALDMRLFHQEEIAHDLFFADFSFGAKSRVAKLLRSKRGMAAALSEVVSAVLVGIAYLFVCLKCWGGAFPIGSCTQYIGAITALLAGMSSLMYQIQQAGSNVLFLQRLFEFLDIPNRMYQGTLTVEKRKDCNYEIEFRNVSFHYPGSEFMALKNVNLKFRIGEKMAIVGENGSGKTTFIKLLCRLYDPTEGAILLNGIDIRKYDYREYLSIFSIVFQDFKLLSFGLGENVAAARSYDSFLAEAVLRKAGFGKRLDTLPEGLDTILNKDFSDKGIQISGGEAQKIAIARALYRNAPFIILDEPTAALDPVAEYEIYSRFNEIVGNRTAVYISHRLSSCRFCDEIIVFHEGSMMEKGSHEELLAKEGKYSELWHAQAVFYQKEAVSHQQQSSGII